MQIYEYLIEKTHNAFGNFFRIEILNKTKCSSRFLERSLLAHGICVYTYVYAGVCK